MEIPTTNGVPDTPVRDNTGILMKCVCCLVGARENYIEDRCGAITNIDQPFCDSCEQAGHNDPAQLGVRFQTIPMEQLQEERRQALAERNR